MKKRTFFFILFVLGFNLYSQLIVTYPNINNLGKNTISYAILDLALEKSGEDYEIHLLDYRVNDDSQRVMLLEGKIDVADFGTSKEFEKIFLPIYFPLDLGANGWRLLIIHKDNENKFAKVKSLTDLREFTTGLGENWADIKIFEESNITVLQAQQKFQLLGMLDNKRFDYLSLGAHGIHWYLEQHQKQYPDLIVEKNLVITYPFARFFFVQKGNTKLRDIILLGMTKAFEDGSFLKLFKNHPYGRDLFNKSNIQNRIQIKLENNYISEEFKMIPPRYFFNTTMLEN